MNVCTNFFVAHMYQYRNCCVLYPCLTKICLILLRSQKSSCNIYDVQHTASCMNEPGWIAEILAQFAANMQCTF